MRKRRVWAGIITVLLSVTMTMPSFALSEEEQAAYEDSLITYDELPGLIEHYNTEVQNNGRSYRAIRYDDNEEGARMLREKAEDLRDQYEQMMAQADRYQGYGSQVLEEGLQGGDISGKLNNYGRDLSGIYQGAAQLEKAAAQLERQADDLDKSSVDTLMYQIRYDQTEASLVQAARKLYQNVVTMELQIDQAKSQKMILEQELRAVQQQEALGMADAITVENARKRLSDAEQQLTALKSQRRSLLQSLCLMIGRGYQEDITLGALPPADSNSMAGLHPEEDKKTAVGNSFTLRYARREYANFTKNSEKKSALAEIAQEELKISETIDRLYLAAQESYDSLLAARANHDGEAAKLRQAEIKYQTGMISRLDYDRQQAAFTGSEAEVSIREAEFFLALEEYQSVVAGL